MFMIMFMIIIMIIIMIMIMIMIMIIIIIIIIIIVTVLLLLFLSIIIIITVIVVVVVIIIISILDGGGIKNYDMFASFTPSFGQRVKLRLKSERALNEVFTAYLCDTCSSCRWFFGFFPRSKAENPASKHHVMFYATHLSTYGENNNFIPVPDAGRVACTT